MQPGRSASRSQRWPMCRAGRTSRFRNWIAGADQGEAMPLARILRMSAVLLVGASLVQTACAQALEPLAMSYVPGNAIAWDLDVAMDKGFLKAEGFEGRPVVFQNAPQSAQMLITGEVQLGTGQIDPFLLAFRNGARDIAVIAAPADRPDWFINVRPEIRSVADLKGKFVATAALQVGETWFAAKWFAEQGLKPQDWNFLVVGTSALKFAA